jgi:hypothetical protein
LINVKGGLIYFDIMQKATIDRFPLIEFLKWGLVAIAYGLQKSNDILPSTLVPPTPSQGQQDALESAF